MVLHNLFMLFLATKPTRGKYLRGINSEVLEEGVSLGPGAINSLDVAEHFIKGDVFLEAVCGTLLTHAGTPTVHLH